MSVALLLDEMHAPVIAATLRERGDNVLAVVDHDEPRGLTDEQLFRWAAEHGRCIVTENVNDFAPLARQADESATTPRMCCSQAAPLFRPP